LVLEKAFFWGGLWNFGRILDLDLEVDFIDLAGVILVYPSNI
jgi:hypothetical protein